MSPGYLEAAGTRLLSGRDVSWHDTAKTPVCGDREPNLRAAKCGAKRQQSDSALFVSGKLTEVVGVAEDGKYHDLQEPPQPVVYVPLSQSEQSEAVLVVRSRRAPNEMAAALATHTERHRSGCAHCGRDRWSDALDGELFPARAATVALGVMGLLAAMLAVTGIFGMAAYSVSRRMKELGIRVALGARRDSK